MMWTGKEVIEMTRQTQSHRETQTRKYIEICNKRNLHRKQRKQLNISVKITDGDFQVSS